MTSDIDYAEPLKRVLFSSNKKEEINRTIGVTPTQKCFDVKAYLRVSMATKAGIYKELNTLKVMLHETIRNGDFKRNTALQPWNNVATIRFNVATMLLPFVALKIVIANRPLLQHLYGLCCLNQHSVC